MRGVSAKGSAGENSPPVPGEGGPNSGGREGRRADGKSGTSGTPPALYIFYIPCTVKTTPPRTEDQNTTGRRQNPVGFSPNPRSVVVLRPRSLVCVPGRGHSIVRMKGKTPRAEQICRVRPKRVFWTSSLLRGSAFFARIRLETAICRPKYAGFLPDFWYNIRAKKNRIGTIRALCWISEIYPSIMDIRTF